MKMKGSEKFRIGEYDCWTLADGELSCPGSNDSST